MGRLPSLDDAIRVLRDSLVPATASREEPRPLRLRLGRILVLVIRQLGRDRCTQQAAALAFQSAVSIVPIVVVAFTVMRALDVFQSNAQTLAFLAQGFLPAASRQVARSLADLLSQADMSTLGGAGVASLVITSFMLLHSVDRVVNDVWRVHHRRPMWKKALVFGVIMTLSPVLLATSVHYGRRFLDVPTMGTFVAPVALTSLWLFLAYWLLPATAVRPRHAFVPAVLTAAILEGLKILFNLYAHGVRATYDSVYGTIAFIPVFLVWLHLTWLVVLAGVELGYVSQNLTRLWQAEAHRERPEKKS